MARASNHKGMCVPPALTLPILLTYLQSIHIHIHTQIERMDRRLALVCICMLCMLASLKNQLVDYSYISDETFLLT
jgi:hypothetical protein